MQSMQVYFTLRVYHGPFMAVNAVAQGLQDNVIASRQPQYTEAELLELFLSSLLPQNPVEKIIESIESAFGFAEKQKKRRRQRQRLKCNFFAIFYRVIFQHTKQRQVLSCHLHSWLLSKETSLNKQPSLKYRI